MNGKTLVAALFTAGLILGVACQSQSVPASTPVQAPTSVRQVAVPNTEKPNSSTSTPVATTASTRMPHGTATPVPAPFLTPEKVDPTPLPTPFPTRMTAYPTHVPLAFTDDAPLHEAAFYGDVNSVEELLVQGEYVNYVADVEFAESGQVLHEVTPLHLAAWNNTPEVVELLLEWEGNPEAMSYDYGPVVGQVPRYIPPDGGTPATFAATLNLSPIVLKLFLMWGADVKAVDEDKRTLLHHAAAYNPSSGVILELIVDGSDINASYLFGDTPLHRAAEYNTQWKVTYMLLAKGSNIAEKNGVGRTPLHLAAMTNPEPAVTKLLLDRGADLEERDERGLTPLHNAAWNPEPLVVKMLLDRGANIKTLDEEGNTPLFYAVHGFSTPDVLSLLLDRGADIEAKNQQGMWPLRQAVEGGDSASHGDLYLALAAVLLNRGANTERRDASGNTVLHIAAEEDIPRMFSLLVELGANLNAKNADGETPCQVARNHMTDSSLLIRFCPT